MSRAVMRPAAISACRSRIDRSTTSTRRTAGAGGLAPCCANGTVCPANTREAATATPLAALRHMTFALHPIQLVVQRLEADPQHVGGARLVAARRLEGGDDQLLLRFVHRHPRRQRDAGRR